MKLDIDFSRCVRCGACVRDCPRKIIRIVPDGYPELIPEKMDQCIDCQHCVCVCPKLALTVNGHNPKDATPKCDFPTPASMMNLIKMRRSYRHYKPENISDKQIAFLKEMLAYPPTGVNTQDLHYTFIWDKAVMDKFRWLTFEALDHATQGATEGRLLHFANIVRANEKGRDALFCSAPHMVVVSCPPDIPCPDADPFIALSYFELMAHTMGIGTLWCGLLKWAFTLIAPQLTEKLQIPAGYEVKYVMLFGLPDVRYFRAVQRGPISCNVLQ